MRQRRPCPLGKSDDAVHIRRAEGLFEAAGPIDRSSGNYPLPNGVQQPTRPLTMRIPTLDSWNMMIQQQLSNTASLQTGWV
jgi:hypothetical protein